MIAHVAGSVEKPPHLLLQLRSSPVQLDRPFLGGHDPCKETGFQERQRRIRRSPQSLMNGKASRNRGLVDRKIVALWASEPTIMKMASPRGFEPRLPP